MEPILRQTRDACIVKFTTDGRYVLTQGDYYSAWELPTLRRIYRVRFLETLSRDSRLQALIPPDNMRVATNEGPHLKIAMTNDGFAVYEEESKRVLWQNDGGRLSGFPLPVVQGSEWAILRDNKIEIWRWPFATAPVRTLATSGGTGFRPVIWRNRIAIDNYHRIDVLDLDTGRSVFSLDCASHAQSYWMHDGWLIAATANALRVCDPTGIVRHELRVPTLNEYRVGCSPVRDDVVLGFDGGMMFISDFLSYLRNVSEIPRPWSYRELLPDSDGRKYSLSPDPASELASVDAATPEELEVQLESFARPAWIPVLREERGPIDGNKMGGVAWLGQSEDWPRCGRCNGFMDLFLQLNSAELPAGCPPLFEGLLQLFVCTYETPSDGCNPWGPFSKAAYGRVVAADGAPRYQELPDLDLYEELRIIAWTACKDLPGANELETLGIELDDAQTSMHIDGDFPFPRKGDKLLGWADWIQNFDPVSCPKCGTPMAHIFQFKCDAGVPYNFKDGGTGYLSQCPEHRDVVTFQFTC